MSHLPWIHYCDDDEAAKEGKKIALEKVREIININDNLSSKEKEVINDILKVFNTFKFID